MNCIIWHVNYLDFNIIYIKYLHIAYIAVAQTSDSYAEMQFIFYSYCHD